MNRPVREGSAKCFAANLNTRMNYSKTLWEFELTLIIYNSQVYKVQSTGRRYTFTLCESSDE